MPAVTAGNWQSFVPLQLPLGPMRLFAVGGRLVHPPPSFSAIPLKICDLGWG